MIRILGKIPNEVIVACSGGVDSMAIVDFLLRGRKSVTIAYFHHGTEHGEEAFSFLSDFSTERKIPLAVGIIKDSKVPKGRSTEEYWRDERYKFLHSFEAPVITAHHLDDVIETWLFSSFHGTPKLIPYRNKNVIRPFLTTRKEKLVGWCKRHDVPTVEDPSNKENKYMRNHIRNSVVPEVLKVNPGIHKTIKKKVLLEFKENNV